jgi:hypothetical protein
MKNLFSNRIVKLILIFTVIILLFLLFRKAFFCINEYFSVPDVNSLEPGFNDADKFIKYGYPEIKSLSIQLLTLLTTILVFSVTFSEKIVNYNQTRLSIRLILISGWTLFIFAIVSDCIGLAYNAYALPYALTDLNVSEKQNIVSAEFYEPAFNSIIAILMSGVFFIAGLICIVIAGVISIFIKPQQSL